MSLFAWPQCALMAEGNISPNPERREDEGRMWLFTFGLLLAMAVVASAITYYLSTAPWAQGFWETVR